MEEMVMVQLWDVWRGLCSYEGCVEGMVMVQL